MTRADGTRPLLIAVTQLTSTDERALHEELLIDRPMEEVVLSYAARAKECGTGRRGLLAARGGQRFMHAAETSFLTVTPGVRFADGDKGDQKRVATPAEATRTRFGLHCGGAARLPPRPIRQAAYGRCVREFLRQTNKEVNTNGERQRNDCERFAVNQGGVFPSGTSRLHGQAVSKVPVYCDNRLTLTAPEVRTTWKTRIAEPVMTSEYPEAEVLMGTSTAGIAHAAIAAHILRHADGLRAFRRERSRQTESD